MKILLIGEFSAFFKNLKIGFLSLGNEVTLMAGEDSWKKIDGADISINSKLPGFFGKISRRIQYLYNVIFLSKYDVILIVNPNIGLSFISKLFSILPRNDYHYQKLTHHLYKFQKLQGRHLYGIFALY